MKPNYWFDLVGDMMLEAGRPIHKFDNPLEEGSAFRIKYGKTYDKAIDVKIVRDRPYILKFTINKGKLLRFRLYNEVSPVVAMQTSIFVHDIIAQTPGLLKLDEFQLPYCLSSYSSIFLDYYFSTCMVNNAFLDALNNKKALIAQ